jgi:hypothetical protein
MKMTSAFYRSSARRSDAAGKQACSTARCVFYRTGVALLLLFSFFNTPYAASGQSDSASQLPEYMKYQWDSVPVIHALSDAESKMGTVVIKEKRIIEYRYDKPGEVAMYVTEHKIIRVNWPDAIEENNTVYISMSDVSDVVSLKARSISPEGRVVPLNPANIRDVDNYSNMGPYKIFAIDGMEAGGEAEFIYTLREPFKLTNSEYIKGKTLIKNYEFDIYSPKDLVFKAKSYNGFPEMQTDTTLAGRNRLFAKAKDITGRKTEEFSAGDASQMRMEYKFTYNARLNPKRELYTYDDFSAKMFELIDQTATKKDRKTADEFTDTLGLGKLTSDSAKICKIERTIKKLVSVDENASGNKYLSPADMIKDKVTNELGIIKLYYLVFEAAGIGNEIVATTDRFEKAFDPDFESWAYLQKFMFYFPSTGAYLAPTEPLSHYGYPPSGWICQKGLFIHPVALEKNNTGAGEIKDIGCNDWRKSMSNVYADMAFDRDMSVTRVNYRETMTGYEINEYAQASLFASLSDDDRQEFITNFLKAVFPDAKPLSDTITGCGVNDKPATPFTIAATLNTGSLLERAGDEYIFKIGLVIGPQSELYRDSVRQSPIRIQYNHGYHRVLVLHIPQGYKVTNPEALKMDVSDKPDSTRTMEFRSAYSIAGDSIIAVIDEDYRQDTYPVAMYDEFRKVINASADFNKVVLFLDKK